MPSTRTKVVNLPLNRVEGDLELKLEIQHGVVTEAWSCGTMYRGFENMLIGRAPKDGLVLTPRVCGICGTAHLLAAAKALDMVCNVQIPKNALIVRNVTSMAEHLQSDLRHGILMFMTDFTNGTYRDRPFYQEAVERYEPFKGRSVIQAIKSTKHIIEIVAIIGGQWPNSSYMVPGGVANQMTNDDIATCRYILTKFRKWYEKQVLGCSLDRWNSISTSDELDNWYEESESHRKSEIGFFIHCCRETGLDKPVDSQSGFISYGQFEFPDQYNHDFPQMVLSPGFFHNGTLQSFDQKNISEHVAHSQYEDYTGGLHPFHGATEPWLEENLDEKYSLTKAPRYLEHPAETGPLSEMLCSSNPLFLSLNQAQGPTVFARQLARFARAAVLLPHMQQWLEEVNPNNSFYSPVQAIPDGRGYGLTGGCRGALGHWVTITNGEIERYQIITPTSWNGSPRDSDHVRGPWEQAVIGAPLSDPDNPIEVGHIIRSFDACQVCSVHTVRKK